MHHDFENMDNDKHIDLRNPLIVIMGDSVSASYFEQNEVICAHNLPDSYSEKFKWLLLEKYPETILNMINSSLAGDNIGSMLKRVQRDLIDHQPDLVILNASLNWSIHRGTLEQFSFSMNQ